MSVIVYAHISEDTRRQLMEYRDDPKKCPMSPAINLLQQFIHSDLVNSEIRNRFKVIARLMNPKHTDFGFVANRLVSRYNAKPFLARTSSTFYHEPGRYFGADIDVHVFGYPARQGLSYVKGTIQTAVYDIGFTVEGKEDRQLPEQILACCRISKIGMDVAKAFPEDLYRHYQRHRTGTEKEKGREIEQKEMGLSEHGQPHLDVKAQSESNLLKNGKKTSHAKTGSMSARTLPSVADKDEEESTENSKGKKGKGDAPSPQERNGGFFGGMF